MLIVTEQEVSIETWNIHKEDTVILITLETMEVTLKSLDDMEQSYLCLTSEELLDEIF